MELPTAVISQLETTLLSIGGTTMIVDPEIDLATDLVRDGAVCDLPVLRVRGRSRNPHANAAMLWSRNPERFKLATGYALRGQTWSRHSWVTDGTEILDTTTTISHRFGFVLDSNAAAEFWHRHYLWTMYPRPMAILAELEKPAAASETKPRHSLDRNYLVTPVDLEENREAVRAARAAGNLPDECFLCGMSPPDGFWASDCASPVAICLDCALETLPALIAEAVVGYGPDQHQIFPASMPVANRQALVGEYISANYHHALDLLMLKKPKA